MRQFPLLGKIWPVVVIASMLALQLAGIVQETAVAPAESARFEISGMVNDDGSAGDCLLKTEPEISFNVDLLPAGTLRLAGDRRHIPGRPASTIPPRKEIIAEIFIPPITVS